MKHNPQPFCVYPGLSEYFYMVTKCLSRLGFCSIGHQIWSQGLDSANCICWIFFAQSGWGWSAGDENQSNSFRLFQKTPDLFSRGLNRNWVSRGAASTQTSKRECGPRIEYSEIVYDKRYYSSWYTLFCSGVFCSIVVNTLFGVVWCGKNTYISWEFTSVTSPPAEESFENERANMELQRDHPTT